MVTIMINAGIATIISNPDNIKVSIMNYDTVLSNVIEDYEDHEDTEIDIEEYKYNIDSVGCYYQEQGNI